MEQQKMTQSRVTGEEGGSGREGVWFKEKTKKVSPRKKNPTTIQNSLFRHTISKKKKRNNFFFSGFFFYQRSCALRKLWAPLRANTFTKIYINERKIVWQTSAPPPNGQHPWFFNNKKFKFCFLLLKCHSTHETRNSAQGEKRTPKYTLELCFKSFPNKRTKR